ncbi:MAG: molybdate ABC transporter substrate-binding protein [Vicinamibacterales bacterium]
MATGATGQAPATAPGVLIFAAASLQTALDELAPAMERTTGRRVRTSYAASSALARQIESGAPADLFISADLDWMDYLAARKLIRAESRINLVGNELVLVRSQGRNVSVKIGQGFPLAASLGTERLALADPSAVPAGRYAQAALTTLGVWASVAHKLAPAENVRAALMLVSRGEAPLGIVYRTDALADRGVVIVDAFPANTHPAIVYPAALTTSATSESARVLEFLRGAAAQAVFARQGFVALPDFGVRRE